MQRSITNSPRKQGLRPCNSIFFNVAHLWSITNSPRKQGLRQCVPMPAG